MRLEEHPRIGWRRSIRSLVLVTVMALVVGSLGVVTACCSTATEMDDRGNLDIALSRHHLDLRWSRLPAAARFVHNDLKATFIEDWERRLDHIELTDVEVLQVYETGNGIAEVTVHIGYIEKKTQRLREHTSSERWELTDGQWIATRVAELDDAA